MPLESAMFLLVLHSLRCFELLSVKVNTWWEVSRDSQSCDRFTLCKVGRSCVPRRFLGLARINLSLFFNELLSAKHLGTFEKLKGASQHQHVAKVSVCLLDSILASGWRVFPKCKFRRWDWKRLLLKGCRVCTFFVGITSCHPKLAFWQCVVSSLMPCQTDRMRS